MYYLFWIAESVDQIHAPQCEIATASEYLMYEYVKANIQKYYSKGEHVVMHVKTAPGLPFSDNNRVYVQSTFSVYDFIQNFKEDTQK